MARVHEVRLELVRPGPPHNQLLSPLTPYLALCGDGSPITFHIDFEHRQLLNRLEGIRYVTPEVRGGYDAIPNRLREAGIRELGQDMSEVLARIPSLNAELSRARACATQADGSEFVHLRIVLSGSELSVLPFELARAPQSFPGEGLDLSLQGSLPVVLTREVRRSCPLPISWDVDEPKVLLVTAAPDRLTVPTSGHVRALRCALDPWIEWPDDKDPDPLSQEQQPLDCVKARLRVLPDASIERIYAMCAEERFTHIHILAHGDHYEEAGEQRFGIALCADGRPDKKHVVSGEQLARALRAEDEGGVSRSQPLVVTLATCDSGQQGSVLVPGGSIAHDLHAAGIPWIFASQFPLTKLGSTRMAEFLYPRLLRGDDPRQVLYELRRQLSMSASREHDWASIVAYASIEKDFEHKIDKFFENRTVKAINVQMSRADNLVQWAADSGANEKEAVRKPVEQALVKAQTLLERWVRRMPAGKTLGERTTRANCLGIKGSTLKRVALLHASLGRGDVAKSELEGARDAYREAMYEWVTEEARFSWTASQYLSLSAVTGAAGDSGVHAVCRRLAERDLYSRDRSLEAWAHATLAELELLSLSDQGEDQQASDVEKEIVDHCKKIVELMGPDSFHVKSTRRQFLRYAKGWGIAEPDVHTNGWKYIAEAAVAALTPKNRNPLKVAKKELD